MGVLQLCTPSVAESCPAASEVRFTNRLSKAASLAILSCAPVGEVAVADLVKRVLADLVAVHNRADPQTELGRALQAPDGDAGADRRLRRFGGGQQRFPRMGAPRCQAQVAASHQVLTGIDSADRCGYILQRFYELPPSVGCNDTEFTSFDYSSRRGTGTSSEGRVQP